MAPRSRIVNEYRRNSPTFAKRGNSLKIQVRGIFPMAVNSVITNDAAMVALKSLNTITTQLASVQKQVATGYRVADSTDDGAAYAVAQTVRGDVAGLTAANTALGGVQGLLTQTNSALTDMSNLMQTMQGTLTNMSNASNNATTQTDYVTQFQAQYAQFQADYQGASYNGLNLTNASQTADVNVTANGNGGTYALQTQNMSTVWTSLSGIATDAASAAAALTATGTFTKMMTTVGNALNAVGSQVNYVNNQISFNSDSINALNSGVGALVDANMAQESAQLQSLQIQQQLATSALSVADQSPSILVKLFG
jgi:flagellin